MTATFRRALPLALALTVALSACQKTPAPAPVRSTEPMAVHTPPPVYPMELGCEDIGGQVVLKVTIGTDGKPSAINLLRSSQNKTLDDSAVAAVRGWTFRAATRNGQPVPISIQVPVTFTPPQVRPESCFVYDEEKKNKL
ncbi:energy transducer TonB [Lysobacter silvisoli]|uniref:Energy transducer TonB n=1 Tax=Lysobacter silvisoli TaxID=2293254 RepID=A0A371K453_9GAMM|nr:energy transducer TonB [Lysobacter silvisoli]RDZ28703.1 energy transducer TonB [Lysobacter silvisoli]